VGLAAGPVPAVGPLPGLELEIGGVAVMPVGDQRLARGEVGGHGLLLGRIGQRPQPVPDPVAGVHGHQRRAARGHLHDQSRGRPVRPVTVVEQDEPKDVYNCVEAILRTQIGDRVELPDFGHEDWTFDTQPINLAGVQQSIAINEPRAITAFEQEPDWLDPLIAKVLVKVSQIEEVT